MPQFTPSVSYPVLDNNSLSKPKQFNVKTYALIKKNMLQYMKECCLNDPQVSVYRSRRGEWGEWFEHWVLDGNGKPKIIKQGWQ